MEKSLLDKILFALYEANRMAMKDKDLRPSIVELSDEMKKIFRLQRRLYLKQFSKYKDRFAESLAGAEHESIMEGISLQLTNRMIGALKKAHGKAMMSGASTTINELGIDMSFDLENERARKFLDRHAAEMVSEINQTTKNRIATILQHQAREGWNYKTTADKIKEEFTSYAEGRPQWNIESRADMIAKQENAMAFEHGNYEAGQQARDLGIELEKYWDNDGSERVCPICHGNTDDGWIDFDQPHQSGHQHPPGHVACNCTELKRQKRKHAEQENISVNDWTNEQKSAIVSYGSANYSGINSALRKGDIEKSDWFDEVTEIQEALRSAKKFEGKLYRGMDFHNARSFRDFIDNIQEGVIMTERGFMSTTKDPKIAQRFYRAEDVLGIVRGRVKFEIEAKGKNAVDVTDILGENEKEVIFQRDSKFKVLSVKTVTEKNKYDEDIEVNVIGLEEL